MNYKIYILKVYIKKGEINMEKLFFSITRWLMLIGTAIAFIFLIGGGIYALKLYETSKDTYVSKNLYNTKSPDVSFDKYQKLHEEDQQAKEQQRLAIEKYVLKTIKNGSSGHGYTIGNMPQNMIKNENAKIVSRYVSKQFSEKKPLAFGACAACHGEDGKGMNGASPSLLKLPIYNGLVSKVRDNVAYAPSESQKTVKKYTNPLQQYSAKLTGYVNKYAITVGQEGTTVDKMFAFVTDLEKRYDNDSFLILKVQLDSGLKSLLTYSKHLKQSQENTKEAIIWRNFISWFLKDFDVQIEQENQKYKQSVSVLEQKRNQKNAASLDAKIELMQLLTALGVALIAFILLTMILVLFKIESNTRTNTEIEESLKS
jgi:cytochrome c553